MWGFEGDYRRRPKQSLSGKSRTVDKQTLLNKLRTEREQRQTQKRKEESALKIQKWFRSQLCRLHILQKQRQSFDSLLGTVNKDSLNEETAHQLISYLLQFFNTRDDSERMIKVCQMLIKDKKSLAEWIQINFPRWKYTLPRLMSLAFNLIDGGKKSAKVSSHSVPLRLVEVLCMSNILSDANTQRALNESFFFYVLKKGYYSHLVKLFILKVPEVYELTSSAPTPMAASIMDLLILPIKTLSIYGEDGRCNVLYGEIVKHLIANSDHSQIRNFVLPSIYSVEEVNQSFINGFLYFVSDNICLLTDRCNPDFILSFIKLCCSKNGIPPLEGVNSLFKTANYLLGKTPAAVWASSVKSQDADLDSDSDEEETDDEEPVNLTAENKKMLEMCVNELDSPSIISWILAQAEAYINSPEVLVSFCKFFHRLLIAHGYQLHKCRLLYGVALKRDIFLRPMWTTLTNLQQGGAVGQPYKSRLLQLLSNGYLLSVAERDVLIPLLSTFSASLTALLSTLHDSEFLTENVFAVEKTSFPFSIEEIVSISRTLRDVCVGLTEIAHPDMRPASYISASNRIIWTYCFKVCVGVVRHLHLRDTRRNFCSANHWVSEKVSFAGKSHSRRSGIVHSLGRRRAKLFSTPKWLTREELECGVSRLSVNEQRYVTLLQEIPFVIPFDTRMTTFRSLMQQDRDRHRDDFMHGPMIDISIRRTHLYEDSFDKLSPNNEGNLRLRMRIHFINAVGLDEAGVDGGGVFREFLSELLHTSFDPNRGFFLLTNDNTLYPNPSAHLINSDYEKHFYFIGRIFGKMLYESLLVEIPLAGFFLSKLLCGSSVEFHHLDSLDHELCRNLLSLKSYNGSVQDLGIDFTVMNSELGQNNTVELIPNGSNIPVTNENCIEYIYRMADYKLNKQIAKQCQAFKEGVFDVVDASWLRLFSWKELQMLISGAVGKIDHEDLKTNTIYLGHYHAEHPTIISFWKVVAEFDDQQRRKLIKFVTSCSRPPLMGFKELNPPFCIYPSGSEDRLPTAFTCMNILKLPNYTKLSLLKEKLIYAITSNTGFELS